MLILTRRLGENIRIGENISVAVLGIRGNQVRLGIDAPKTLPVHREEIYQRIKNERNAELPVNSQSGIESKKSGKHFPNKLDN